MNWASGVAHLSLPFMTEVSQVKTPGDLEAVVLSESYDLLRSMVGPYMYRVSGDPGQQQATFGSAEIQALFYIRVHEFVADATRISASPNVPSSLSLFSGGHWIAERHPAHAQRTGFKAAYDQAKHWLSAAHRIVFWAPSIWRHLRLELPMSTLVAMRANMEKHQLLRLDSEIRRLHSRLNQSGCDVSLLDTVNARGEFEDHIRGMLEYHATEVAEHIARCFRGLYHFVRELYLQNPTNNLDAIAVPSDISDDVFRYMYASTVFGLSQWTDQRIVSSIPETAPSFKMSYPQNQDWGIVDSERRDT